MKENYCRKTKYLNYYSLRLLIGSLCLTLPTLSAIILLIVWESFDFIWVPILFGILGWFFILPSTYALVRPSKERVAVDALSMGFVAMLCLCSAVISFKGTSLIETLEDQLLQRVNPRIEQFDPKERGITSEYLEQFRLRIEEINVKTQTTNSSELEKAP